MLCGYSHFYTLLMNASELLPSKKLLTTVIQVSIRANGLLRRYRYFCALLTDTSELLHFRKLAYGAVMQFSYTFTDRDGAVAIASSKFLNTNRLQRSLTLNMIRDHYERMAKNVCDVRYCLNCHVLSTRHSNTFFRYTLSSCRYGLQSDQFE